MDLFPAIDIRDGRVVRLSQGEPTRATIYSDDPVAQAEAFVQAGATWIHVVDLDRAFGDGDNSKVMAALASRVGYRVRLQASGGLRSLELVRATLGYGVSRVVVGTVAVTRPALIPAIIQAVGPEAIAVGLDARQGKVAIRGWVETTGESVDVVAHRVIGAGARTIIYTDVERDGMLTGPDIMGALALQRLGARVVVSGGVGKLEDLHAVRAAGLAGAIVGRAIYAGRFTLEEALRCC